MKLFNIVKWNLTQLTTRSQSGQQRFLQAVVSVLAVFQRLFSVWYILQRLIQFMTRSQSGQQRFGGVSIVSWPSVSVCLVLSASCSVCSSHMVVRTLGLRLSLLCQCGVVDSIIVQRFSAIPLQKQKTNDLRTLPILIRNRYFPIVAFVCFRNIVGCLTGLTYAKSLKTLQNSLKHRKQQRILQGVKLRLIQAPMRQNFSLWRPNPECQSPFNGDYISVY